MIRLTRLNHQELVVNVAHIVSVEATPDTIVTLYSGEKLFVCETPTEVIERATKYLQRCGGLGVPVRIPLSPAESEDL
jgi:flagellar protein FlbD